MIPLEILLFSVFVVFVFFLAVFILGIVVRADLEYSEFVEEEELEDDSQVSVGTLEKPEDPQQLEKPTKEQLAALKQKLAIEKGSLQFKGGSVYLVISNRDSNKHVWKRLGRWKDLADSLTKPQLQ